MEARWKMHVCRKLAVAAHHALPTWRQCVRMQLPGSWRVSPVHENHKFYAFLNPQLGPNLGQNNCLVLPNLASVLLPLSHPIILALPDMSTIDSSIIKHRCKRLKAFTLMAPNCYHGPGWSCRKRYVIKSFDVICACHILQPA